MWEVKGGKGYEVGDGGGGEGVRDLWSFFYVNTIVGGGCPCPITFQYFFLQRRQLNREKNN